tara:strand:- start:2935 stop:3237 length:303 start_codon:yes stop_codon:yes gene_type:complete
MDNNYLYMRASQEEEGFSNFKFGDLFGGGDGKNAGAIALAGLGIGATLLATRRARKEKEAADAIAAANNNNKPSNTPLIIVGGLAVVGIGLAIYFGTRKK